MSTKKGRAGEEQAALFLQKKGYTILARNVRAGRGELDIVAKKDDVIAFVEVKAHQQRTSSLQAMTHDKCSRLRSAAMAWLGQHPKASMLSCRFDLIMVSPSQGLKCWASIEHIQDAFR
ncbi:MAG: YraN family protein [Mariprofundaceae bacterium]|nr:YraN family protein [Mariprofundaceae bacterium]